MEPGVEMYCWCASGQVLYGIVNVEQEGVGQPADVFEAPGRHMRLPQGGREAGGQCQQHQRRGGDAQFVPLEEFARNVGRGIAARQHRPAFQMTADVLRQLVHRTVALVRVLAERLQDDGVEIAAQTPVERLRIALAALADLFGRQGLGGSVLIGGRFGDPANHRAGRLGILLAHRPDPVRQRTRGSAVGTVAGE